MLPAQITTSHLKYKKIGLLLLLLLSSKFPPKAAERVSMRILPFSLVQPTFGGFGRGFGVLLCFYSDLIVQQLSKVKHFLRKSHLISDGQSYNSTTLSTHLSDSSNFAFWRRKDHTSHPFALSESPNCYTSIHKMARWERKAKAKSACKICLQVILFNKMTFTQREEKQLRDCH